MNISTNRHAFSLVELLVVVAIIGILAAVLVPNVRTQLVRAEMAATDALIEQMDLVITSYESQFDRYPPSYDLVGLHEALTEEAPNPMEPDQTYVRAVQAGERLFVDEQTGNTELEEILDQSGFPSEGLVAQEDGYIFVDSWNQPIIYVSSDTYNPGRLGNARNRNNAPAAYDTNFGDPKPYNSRSFQLISVGPDGLTMPAGNNTGGIGSMLRTDKRDNDGDDFVDLADQVRPPGSGGDDQANKLAEDDITNFD